MLLIIILYIFIIIFGLDLMVLASASKFGVPWYTMLYHSFLLYTVVNNGIPIPCLPW